MNNRTQKTLIMVCSTLSTIIPIVILFSKELQFTIREKIQNLLTKEFSDSVSVSNIAKKILSEINLVLYFIVFSYLLLKLQNILFNELTKIAKREMTMKKLEKEVFYSSSFYK